MGAYLNSPHLTLVHFSVAETPWETAYKGFRHNGVSEEAFRHFLQKLGVTFTEKFPTLFIAIDDEQLKEIGPNASTFVMIGTSKGVGSSREEAVENFRKNTGAKEIEK